MPAFTDVAELNKYLENYSYVNGYTPSADDVTTFKTIGSEPDSKHANAARWFRNIASYSESERAAWGGAAATSAAAPAAAAAATTLGGRIARRLGDVDITERRMPQNGRITAMIRDRSVDLRVATLPTVWGEKIVLRVLDTGGIDLDVGKLGFTQQNLERFSESFTKPHGLLLVTGPTGSGKSTTLYATLGRISKPEINVITVEDPVEYRLRGVNQVQVNHKAGLTFAAVLPAILRSDPDVVLIGEIRDSTTAQIAGTVSATNRSAVRCRRSRCGSCAGPSRTNRRRT